MLNIGSATINGLEVELSIAPTRDLELALSYAYLDASIDRFPVRAGSIYDPALNNASPYAVGQDIHRLFTLPFAPKSSFSVDADYAFLQAAGGTFSAHLDYRWQDEVFPLLAGENVPNRNAGRQSAYGLLNGRVSFELALRTAGRLNVGLWAKNLLDEEYLTTLGAYGSSATLSGLNVPVGTAAAGFDRTQIQYWGQPRTYGITLDYRY